MARAGDSEGQGGSTDPADKYAAGAEAAAAEQRSVHAEQDYRKKDAVRHIVADAASQKRGGANQMNDGNLKLMKLLTNLECVRKGKPMLKSEIGSIYSRKSRIS